MNKIIVLAMSMMTLLNVAIAQEKVNGVVTAENTGEAIPFVKIKNLANNITIEANEFGQFEIQITSPNDSLLYRADSYVEAVSVASKSAIIKLKQSTLSFDEVVVSNDREIQNKSDIPVSISTVSAQQIEDNKPTSIDQVLNQNAGVLMIDLGNEQHTMSIRRPIDFGASYLYLEDGVPIRTSGVFNHNALLEINMKNTSRIEIIRGPASSLYGSEAIGGAVNFISQRASLKPSAGITVQANNLGYKRVDINAGGTINKKFGLRLGAYYANKTNGILEHSDFNKLSVSLNADYKINNTLLLTWDNTIVDYYAEMSGSLDSAKFFESNYASNQRFTNRDVLAFRSKIGMKKFWKNKSVTSAYVYYRNNSVKQNPSYRVKNDYKPWTGTGDKNLAHGEENNNSFNSYGAIIQHKQKFKWWKASLITGASIDYSPNTYKANYISIYRNDDGVYENFTSQKDSLLVDYKANLVNVAGYVQGSVEPVKNLKIIAALRLDNFQYQFDNKLGSNAFTAVLDGKNNFTQLTPKVGLTYRYRKQVGFYLNYAQGFVPPQVTELYRGVEVAALKPVDYHNYEFGAWTNLWKNKLRMEVAVYLMNGRNEIVSKRQDDGSFAKENAGRTQHSGLELTILSMPVKSLSIRLSGSYSLHKFTDYISGNDTLTGKIMPQAPRVTSNAQITYKPHFLKGFRISAECQYISNYFMDAGNTKTYDGYAIFNVRTGYKWKGIEVWFNVLNIGNQLYSTVARSSKWGDSYSLGNPRSFTIGLGYQFNQK